MWPGSASLSRCSGALRCLGPLHLTPMLAGVDCAMDMCS